MSISKKELEFIRREYQAISQYDLVTDLLIDSIVETDDIKDIHQIVEYIFGTIDYDDVKAAIEDFS
jgi:hypothetical protein